MKTYHMYWWLEVLLLRMKEAANSTPRKNESATRSFTMQGPGELGSKFVDRHVSCCWLPCSDNSEMGKGGRRRGRGGGEGGNVRWLL